MTGDPLERLISAQEYSPCFHRNTTARATLVPFVYPQTARERSEQ